MRIEIRRSNAAPSAGVNWDSFPSPDWLWQSAPIASIFVHTEELPDEKAEADQLG
ncbi:MAG TPA: hypothetical protein VK249_30825 [Anaerolineales bacterium]|nr:hypothetical protein [Anaerolineales bacterium]